MIAALAVVAVAAGAIGLGVWGVRLVRTTSDLYVASRAVTPWWNAAAISGEYLSAASFLGIAGLGMKLGASVLWLPLGFAAGYLALLFFVAAPLRRFGSYTIPDFAEARLSSPRVRLVAAAVVLTIGGFYLVPQLKGAGLTIGRRHARRDLRAGLPVLGQDVRHRAAGVPPAPAPGRPAGAGGAVRARAAAGAGGRAGGAARLGPGGRVP